MFSSFFTFKLFDLFPVESESNVKNFILSLSFYLVNQFHYKKLS